MQIGLRNPEHLTHLIGIQPEKFPHHESPTLARRQAVQADGENLPELIVLEAALGITPLPGQFLGAQAGSRVAMKAGVKIIKPLLVITSIALAIRLMADPSHPIRVWLGW